MGEGGAPSLRVNFDTTAATRGALVLRDTVKQARTELRQAEREVESLIRKGKEVDQTTLQGVAAKRQTLADIQARQQLDATRQAFEPTRDVTRLGLDRGELENIQKDVARRTLDAVKADARSFSPRQMVGITRSLSGMAQGDISFRSAKHVIALAQSYAPNATQSVIGALPAIGAVAAGYFFTKMILEATVGRALTQANRLVAIDKEVAQEAKKALPHMAPHMRDSVSAAMRDSLRQYYTQAYYTAGSTGSDVGPIKSRWYGTSGTEFWGGGGISVTQREEWVKTQIQATFHSWEKLSKNRYAAAQALSEMTSRAVGTSDEELNRGFYDAAMRHGQGFEYLLRRYAETAETAQQQEPTQTVAMRHAKALDDHRRDWLLSAAQRSLAKTEMDWNTD